MSLRRRIALLSAAAVAIAVALGAGVAYVAVRAELLKEVDDALTGQARFVADRAPLALARPGRAALPAPPPRRGGPIAYAQLVSTGGGVVLLGGARLMLPVTPAVRSAAATRTGRFFTDASVNGSRLRVLTVGSADGALQLARPLDGTDSVLRRLRLVLAAVCLIGIALAAGLGR
ncbi:MAG: two-component system, OmpR family, sensor histidine kinase MprB, partial [Solirubrobacteraceae bacterium]|nr:two-component system, OmpR family, sensor histidine kinase MprB [Solirubrobacteraceae bacterium]